MTTPYIGFGNDTLGKLPRVTVGQKIVCPRCGLLHELEAGKNDRGEPVDTLLFYRCGEKAYLGAVAGRLTIKVKPDVSGRLEE